MLGFRIILMTLLLAGLFRTDAFAQTDTIVQRQDTIVAGPDSVQRIKDSLQKDSMQRAVIAAINKGNYSTENIGKYDIKGIVRDKNSGEGIPFAIVFFANSNIGVSADLEGRFAMQFEVPPADTIQAQATGFVTGKMYLDKTRKTAQYIIELERAENLMDEVTIHAGEDPALVLLKKIIRNKPVNDQNKFRNYRYEVYNKLEVDLERLNKKQFERIPIPMTRKFSFIYDNLDTITEGKPFLPFYLTETLSDYYYQKDPKKTKEFIKASIVKGVKNESVTQFLGSMYQNLNSYDNFIPVLDKQFVSPVSTNAAFYYKYKIIDTQEAYGHKIILVQFRPKRNGESCFFGDFWVVDSVFALQRISMEVPKDANLNWVANVSLYQEYGPVGDSLWFCVKDKFSAHFTAPYNAKLPGFIGRKTTSYKDIHVNDIVTETLVNSKEFKQDVYVSDTARHTSEDFWANARHDSLSKNEKAIYKTMDTLEHMPVFTAYKNLIKFFASGVKEFGPIEIGPYWSVYSSNPIEGPRVAFPMGTTPKLFKDIYLNGYVAYGFKDQQFKYKIAGLWLLQRHPRMFVYASYTEDVDRNAKFSDEATSANLFSTIARKPNIPWKLSFGKEMRVEFFKEYFSGFSHQLTLQHKTFKPYDPLPYIGIFKDADGQQTDQITNAEVNIRLRYAYKEKFLEGQYYRVSLGSKYPIVEARYGLGVKGVIGSNYNYHKATISVSDDVKIAPLGSFYFNVFAGKYFGTLPYPLLEAHPGNEFYTYNKLAFNMMNRFEFISDEYAGVNIEHNIGGGIFNYIPYLKKLKLRQFWTAKGVIGSLSDANRQLNLDRGYPFRTLEGNPYVEIGTGVENILQLFRIDFVWRVTPSALPEEPREKYFGIFGSIKFNF